MSNGTLLGVYFHRFSCHTHATEYMVVIMDSGWCLIEEIYKYKLDDTTIPMPTVHYFMKKMF